MPIQPKRTALRLSLALALLALSSAPLTPAAFAQAAFRPTGVTLLPPTTFDPAQAPAFTGQSPLELVRYCARNGIKGIILSIRLSLDGVPVVWPEGMPDGVSNALLPCEQLLWEELAFTDTIPFQDGTQPPVPLEALRQAAAEFNVTLVLRGNDDIPQATWDAIQTAFPELQWEGEFCGLVTPSIGLRPSSPERWTNPFALWQDLLFIPKPSPVWRVGDPRILLTLCGVQPSQPTPDPKTPRVHQDLRRFPVSPEAQARADRVADARTNWLDAPISSRKQVADLLHSSTSRTPEQTDQLALLLRTFTAPAPDISWPATEIRKAASDPDDTCFALALAALAIASPLDVQSHADRAWAVLNNPNTSEQARLAILWAVGQTANPEFFTPVAAFAATQIKPQSSAPLEFALGALSKLISIDGASKIEPWVRSLPPGAHNAAAWCLGQHLPEEAARRAIDQLLDLPSVGTEAKGTALLAMKLAGGPDEIRRLCSLLGHADALVAQDAMFLLLEVQPELLATPLAQTIKASSVLPSAAALAITICGLIESPALNPALQALSDNANSPTSLTLSTLRGWAARKIQRKPGGDGLWGAPETLAVEQLQFTNLLTQLVHYNQPHPSILEPQSPNTNPSRGPLSPITLEAFNPLTTAIQISATIEVPEGEAWQIIPRERQLTLPPDSSESVSFRLRPPANNQNLPRFLLQINGQPWSLSWGIPLPNQSTLPTTAPTPDNTAPATTQYPVRLSLSQWDRDQQQLALTFDLQIPPSTATASLCLLVQPNPKETWAETIMIPVVRHGSPLLTQFQPESPAITLVDRAVIPSGIRLTCHIPFHPTPAHPEIALDYLFVTAPKGIDRYTQKNDLFINALGIGSLDWPPCPTSLLPLWTIPGEE